MKKLKLKYTYLLCALLSPIAVFIVSNTEALGEAVRPDPYGMGPYYYLILLGVALACNALIVSLTQFSESWKVKFRMTVMGTLIALGALIVAGIVFGIIFTVLMNNSHWSFG